MLDLTGVVPDLTDFYSIVTLIVTALVAFWGIKKAIALIDAPDPGAPRSNYDHGYGSLYSAKDGDWDKKNIRQYYNGKWY